MNWFNCNSCGAEFRVVSDSGAGIEYCPHCGDNVDMPEDEDDYEDE